MRSHTCINNIHNVQNKLYYELEEPSMKANGLDIPMGLGMALMQDLESMQQFVSLPLARQQEIIDHTHSIRSKNEMREYVASLF